MLKKDLLLDLIKENNMDKQIYVFGAVEFGVQVTKYLLENNIPISGFMRV
ncbi:hypothetical protein [Lysinibacillus irui]|uniref:Uncharacterized protein n=1 Tax=Lysinibacillus irui TaxID=2998077 RepID=A0AAJ5UWF0_9BACI|nr:hypothetical protein [Lysinibacillus irui]WDV07465.1 hypothetical protein OU989_02990 [Lysinibacillus irui]